VIVYAISLATDVCCGKFLGQRKYAMSLSDFFKKISDEEFLRNIRDRDPASLLIRVRALEEEVTSQKEKITSQGEEVTSQKEEITSH